MEVRREGEKESWRVGEEETWRKGEKEMWRDGFVDPRNLTLQFGIYLGIGSWVEEFRNLKY
jgi:hypothetical protein